MRAFVVGRFQPFHLGHLKVMEDIAKRYDAIIIGIGSAQYSHSPENPFTAGERHLMISKALEEEGILNYYLVPVVDINRYSLWVSHVESLVPPFDIIVTRNPLTARLFKEKGYKVEEPVLYDRERFSGTEIRRRMLAGENWQELVPTAVVEVIEEIEGEARVRELAAETEE